MIRVLGRQAALSSVGTTVSRVAHTAAICRNPPTHNLQEKYGWYAVQHNYVKKMYID